MAKVVKAHSADSTKQKTWVLPDLMEHGAAPEAETCVETFPETVDEPAPLPEEPEENRMPEPPAQDTREEYEAGYKAGYEKGYEKGYAEGEAEGGRIVEERHDATLKSLQQMCDAIISQKKQMLRDAEEEMLSLSFDIAKKILGREANRDDMNIQSLFRQAVDALMEKRRITVRVAMGEGQSLNAFKEELSHDLGLDGFEVVEDPELSSMSCIIETPNERVDAGLDTQLGRVCNELVDRMKVRVDDE